LEVFHEIPFHFWVRVSARIDLLRKKACCEERARLVPRAKIATVLDYLVGMAWHYAMNWFLGVGKTQLAI